ncbi:MAG: hypothetical protein WAJ93_27310 [Candidatus Nitrosopolaris sp.]
MSSEPLLSGIIPFAGSGVAGFFMGMFLRRVLKFLVIIIGSFLGAVFLVIQWMQARQYIQGQVVLVLQGIQQNSVPDTSLGMV